MSTRVYRTGDLGILEAGTLHYRGRADLVWKIAGKKISPYEIERLGSDIVVAVRELAGHAKLVAFAAREPLGAVEQRIEAFVAAARATLPAHMVPMLYSCLDRLPLKPNGKIDRAALAALGEVTFRPFGTVGDPPATALEADVKRRLLDLIGIEDLDREQSFFDAGVTSSEVPALVLRLNQYFTRQLTPAELYAHPSIRQLSERLATDLAPPAGATVFPLSRGHEGPPIFFVHPAGGLSFCYRPAGDELAGRRCYGINAPALGRDKEYRSVEELAALYADAIEQLHQGQVSLVGWSFGGEVAFEMAIQLAAHGVAVENVVLVDTARTSNDAPEEVLAGRRQYFLRNGIDPGSTLARDMLVDMTHHDQLSHRYRPGTYAGSVSLLRVGEGRPDPWNGWRPHCAGGIAVYPVDGDHDYLFDAWYIKQTCAALRQILSRAGDGSPVTRWSALPAP